VHGRTWFCKGKIARIAQLEHPIIKEKARRGCRAIWRLSQLLSGLTERHELDMSYFFLDWMWGSVENIREGGCG